MSDLALDRADDDGEGGPRLLAPVTVAILLAVGIAGFVATLLLGAYAPDLRRTGGAGGHALSDAAIGYGGLVRLADATGLHPRIVRNAHGFATEDLLVTSPPSGYTNVDPILRARGGRPTLIVLPKWAALPSADHPGWVTVNGLTDRQDPARMLAPAALLTIARRPSGGRPLRVLPATMAGIAFAAPRPLQLIAAAPPAPEFGTLAPLITDARGGIVLGEYTRRPLFLLADPDLLDNRGMRDPATAAAALKLLGWMNSNQAQGIAFDVTLNGLGSGASPLKLLFEPPFLAATLTLAAAVLLAALTTVTRFGSPRARTRAVALGKTALVDNTAALVARARAQTRLGGRYAAVMREAAARAFAAPPRLQGAALDAYLDRAARRGGGFTPLAQAVVAAEGKAELLARAQALHDWLKGTGE